MTGPDPAPAAAWYLDGSALARLPAERGVIAQLVAAVADHKLRVVTSPEALLETAGPLGVAAAGATRILDALAATLLPPRHGRAALVRDMDPIAAGDEPEVVAVPPTPFPLAQELSLGLGELGSAARRLTTDLAGRLRHNAELRAHARAGPGGRERLWAALFESAVGDRERLSTLALLLFDALGVDAEPRLLDRALRSPALHALLAVELDRVAAELIDADRQEADPGRTLLRLHHAVVASSGAALVTADVELRRLCAAAWSGMERPRALGVDELTAVLGTL